MNLTLLNLNELTIELTISVHNYAQKLSSYILSVEWLDLLENFNSNKSIQVVFDYF